MDDKGNAAMHALTQQVVRKHFTPETQSTATLELVVGALQAKLDTFDPATPVTYFVGRWYARVRNFAAECAPGGASDTLILVFLLQASNLEHDYLGLHAVFEASKDSGPGAARLAQSPAQSAVRQRVHALLGSSTWRGHWLGVLDDLLAPEAMQNMDMDWLLKDFPWADGRTIITTRAAAVTDAEAMSVAFDAVAGDDKQRQCAECGQIPPALFKGTRCGKCTQVYYCCRLCQQKAWKAHKPICWQIVADRQ